MATNFYFNNFNSSQEQSLLENLLIESIKIYGHEVYYIPKSFRAKDDIYLADPSVEYNTAIVIEMYIKNVEGFEGDGKFFSKFGLEIRDQITLTLARRVFSEEVGTQQGMERPNEGDLIYFPVAGKIFQIKYVDNTAFYYQLGALQTYDLTCEMFEYSGENLNTGIPEIDMMQQAYSPAYSAHSIGTEDTVPYMLLDEDGYPLVNENYNLETIDPLSDNDVLETEGDSIIDFTEIDPFSEGVY
jgi:hypothetical protein